LPFCPNCGKQVGAEENFCSNCGSRLRELTTTGERPAGAPLPQPSPKPGKRVALKVAGILSVVLLGLLVVGAVMRPSTTTPPPTTPPPTTPPPPIPKTVTATIRIESNTWWFGSIGGDGNSRSVDGYGDREFEVTGSIIMAVVQKQTDYGYLRVSILVRGIIMASQETTAAYGLVTVSWP